MDAIRIGFAHNFRKAVFGLFGTVLLLLSTTPDASAKYASLVLEADTGRVIHSVNADTRNYPASLTKMMTLYMVFDALNRGKVHLTTRMPVSARATRQPPSKLALRRGQNIRVKDAILALVTKSANDVAVVIAEHLGGTERKFAKLMTAKAKRIGMARTTFKNASGLPNRGQLSTARDMATLARALMRDFPQYYHYFSTSHFTYGGTRHKNHNKLLTTYQGTDGIKTGYIRASGFNLVASVQRGKKRLIGVVFGGRTSKARNSHMVSLLNKGFKTVGLPTKSTRVAKVVKKRTTPVKATRKASKGGTWGIQVGAYKKYSPAFAIAKKAVSRAPSYLKSGTIQIDKLRKRRSTLYRARIVGIDKRQAYRACRQLKAKRIDCMELKVKDGV